MSILISPSVIY